MSATLGAGARRWAERLGESPVAQATAAGAAVVVAWPILAAVLPQGLPAGVVLQGAVVGSLVGLEAIGLVLVYRAARIVNFAQSALGAAAGVLAIELFSAWGWNYFVALGAGLVAAAVLGLLVERLVVQRFFWAPRLILTVATIGLAQVLGGLQLGLPTLFNQPPIGGAFKTPLSVTFTVEPLIFTGNHVLILILVPACLAGIAWFLYRTDAGVAVRASAENAERAMLVGIPVRRLSAIVWALAAVLSALSMMLTAPLFGITPGVATGPSLLLAPLAAAVIGRLESLPVTLGAGVAIGIFQQATFWNTSKGSIVDVGLLVAIVVTLVVRRRAAGRGSDDGALSSWVGAADTPPMPAELRGLPEVVWARRVLLALALAAAVALPSVVTRSSLSLLGTVAVVYAIIAVSLVVLTGWSGQVSLGQFALAGAGGVVTGKILMDAHGDLILALLAGAAAGTGLAVIIGLPALRIRGLFLAVTTLALAVPVSTYFLNPANFTSLVPTTVHRPFLFGRVDLLDERNLYYFCLAVFVLVVALARGLPATRPGRALVAVRDNEWAAQARGISATATKLTAFAVSGAFAGLAGGLLAVVNQGVRAGSFGPNLSFEAFTMVVVGGLTSVGGAVTGAFFVRWAEYALSGGLQLVVTGAGMLVVLLVLPGGLGQAIQSVRDAYLRRVARRRGLVVPALLSDHRQETADPPAISLDALLEVRRSSSGNGPAPGSGDGADLERRLARLDELEAEVAELRRVVGARQDADR